MPIFFGSPRVVLHRLEPSRAAANCGLRRISRDARHGSDGDGLESRDDDVAHAGLVALQGDQANKPLVDQLLSKNCLEPLKVVHSNQIRVPAGKK